MQEYGFVGANARQDCLHDIAGAGQAGFAMADPAAPLTACFIQPLVDQHG